MKKSTRQPKQPLPPVRLVKDHQLRDVNGGALNAYFESVVGEKQG